VFWHPGAGWTTSNFTGAAIYVEDPDISSGLAASMDNTTPMNASQYDSGTWQPIYVGDSVVSPASVLIPQEAVARNVRIYLAAFGPHTTPTLIRANATTATPTPNIIAVVPPGPTTYTSGQEVAWMVTGQSVTVNPYFNQVPPVYTLTFAYTPPTADQEQHRPPGINPFGGVAIWFKYGTVVGTVFTPDPARPNAIQMGQFPYVASATPPGSQVSWTSTEWPAQKGSFRVYFVSADIYGHQNSIVTGVTPYVDVFIDPAGSNAPKVGSLAVGAMVYQSALGGGGYIGKAPITWTLPTVNPNLYTGCEFWVVQMSGGVAGKPSITVPYQLIPPGRVTGTATSSYMEVDSLPVVTENWRVAAISVDVNGILRNDPSRYGQPDFDSPTVYPVPVGPPTFGSAGSAKEYAPFVTAAAVTVTPTESTSSDGVRQVSFSIAGWVNPTTSDPDFTKFGGVTIAMAKEISAGNPDLTNLTTWTVPYEAANPVTSFVTPKIPAPGQMGVAQNLHFYLVSRSPQGNVNGIIAGITPEKIISYTPTEGNIVPSRSNTSWFNTNEFQWSSNAFNANSIGVGKIQVGSVLQVGGKTSWNSGSSGTPSYANGQIGVFDSTGIAGNPTTGLVGWVGTQQNTQGDGSVISGAWFKALWVGGHAPYDSPVYIDNNGVIIVGGIAAATGATSYPYLSIRNDTGVEYGRMGAKLNSATVGGTGTGSNPSSVGIDKGAWFTQFACGGGDLTNWQILCANDNTLKIRNIYSFTIDYPSTPTNARYQLQMGNNVWHGAAGGTGLLSWVFPGIKITEVDSGGTVYNFGATLINRGIVLRGTDQNNGVGHQGGTVLGSFDMFNGNQQGQDSPLNFWAELVMYSPLSPYSQTVKLQSGDAGVAGSSFILNDGASPTNHLNFSVNTAGDVQVRGKLQGIYTTAAQPVNVQALNVNGLPVIDSTGAWVSTGGPGSGLSDPTTTAGDLIVRGAAAVARLGVAGASTGWVLTVDTAQTLKMKWSAPATISQSPWTGNIDGGGFTLTNVASISTAALTVTGGTGSFTAYDMTVGGKVVIANDRSIQYAGQIGINVGGTNTMVISATRAFSGTTLALSGDITTVQNINVATGYGIYIGSTPLIVGGELKLPLNTTGNISGANITGSGNLSITGTASTGSLTAYDVTVNSYVVIAHDRSIQYANQIGIGTGNNVAINVNRDFNGRGLSLSGDITTVNNVNVAAGYGIYVGGVGFVVAGEMKLPVNTTGNIAGANISGTGTLTISGAAGTGSLTATDVTVGGKVVIASDRSIQYANQVGIGINNNVAINVNRDFNGRGLALSADITAVVNITMSGGLYQGGTTLVNTSAQWVQGVNTSAAVSCGALTCTSFSPSSLFVGGAIGGTVVSGVFTSKGAALGTAYNNEVITASFGGPNANASSLGVSMYRINAGTDWTTCAMVLSYNVDGSLRVNNSMLTFHPSGFLLVGQLTAPTAQTLQVNGGMSLNGSITGVTSISANGSISGVTTFNCSSNITGGVATFTSLFIPGFSGGTPVISSNGTWQGQPISATLPSTINISGSMTAGGGYYIGSYQVIATDRSIQYAGQIGIGASNSVVIDTSRGVHATALYLNSGDISGCNNITCAGVYPTGVYCSGPVNGSSLSAGNGVTQTFRSFDLQTIHVVSGIITAIT